MGQDSLLTKDGKLITYQGKVLRRGGSYGIRIDSITYEWNEEGTQATITVIASGGVQPLEYRVNGGPWQLSNLLLVSNEGEQLVEVRDGVGNIVSEEIKVFSGPPFPELLLSNYRVSNEGILVEDSGLEVELLSPCLALNGKMISGATDGTLIDAYEVEVRFKTSVTTRMGVIGINGMGTISLINGIIVAGTGSVTGNAAAATYQDGNWHILRVVKTGTANVFDIYLDGTLLNKTSNGNWRTSTTTAIGGACSVSTGAITLPFNGKIDYITLKNSSNQETHKWVFVEGRSSFKIYDCIGDKDLNNPTPFLYGYDKEATDHIKVLGASLILNDNEQIVVVPYKNGVKRELDQIHGKELLSNLSNVVPLTSYGVDFNPNNSSDERYNVLNRVNTEIFESIAGVTNSQHVWSIEDLDRAVMLSWYKSLHRGRVFVKKAIDGSIPYLLEEILVYSNNIINEGQEKILKYTKEDVFSLTEDDDGNILMGSFPKENKSIIENIKGGHTARLRSDDPLALDVAQIFENNGYRATFVERTPANITPERKQLLEDLQTRGHDVGFWGDHSFTAIKLYDPIWTSYFTNLDSPFVGQFDEYGSPLNGIGAIIESEGSTYIGLNSQIRYQADDIEVLLVNGTDRLKLLNVPESATLSNFLVLMPDVEGVPTQIRNKWVYCSFPTSNIPADREFPVQPFEGISMEMMGLGTFSNPSNTVHVSSAALDMIKTGEVYTGFNRPGLNTSGPNERARYYTYLHAIMAFEALGLERPYTVGELRNIIDEDSLSTNPLKLLGYKAGGVDPFTFNHSFYFNDRHRWNFRTSGNRIPTLTAQDIFTAICEEKERNAWHTERQGDLYSATELTKWNDLLGFCAANNINVMTMREVGEYLYDSTFSTSINPIPLISVDLNLDNVPDGYNSLVSGTTWGADLVNGNVDSGFAQFTRSSNGEVFSITTLSGIHPGTNNCFLWIKGKQGDRVTVNIQCLVQIYKRGVRFGSNSESRILFNSQEINFIVPSSDNWIKIPGDQYFTQYKNTRSVNITATLTKGGTSGAVNVGQLLINK
jgi:hypothetical protein